MKRTPSSLGLVLVTSLLTVVGTTALTGTAVGAAADRHPSPAHSAARGGHRGEVGDSMWHTQVLAGLTVSAGPHAWHHGSRQKVAFTVNDAHAAVRGAKVKVGSLHCSTNRRGSCSIRFPASYAKGKHTAKATKSGYGAATVGLRVR